MKVDNKVFILSNYTTKDLNRTLQLFGDDGYTLVSALLAPNEFKVQVMYLFFTKEEV